jgi:DNA-binding transcriptional MerR regulator
MVLTRDEKETLVLDLYNHRTPIREIAREAGMSFRDIGRIIDKKEKEKEALQGQVQQITQSTQAYKLFSEDKTPEEVAIALNLRQPQVNELYTEHWKLKGLYMLDQIYGEIKDDIGSFVNLYRLAKATGMNVQYVIRLLAIANNHLPSVEYRYERLIKEVDSLESWRLNSNRILENVTKNIEHYSLCCQRELAQMDQLYQKRMKQQAIVRQFENNNEEYAKIKKTVEEKVHSILSDRRMVLKLALLSLIESMRNDPDKYSHLIHNNNTFSTLTTSTTDYSSSQYYDATSYG